MRNFEKKYDLNKRFFLYLLNQDFLSKTNLIFFFIHACRIVEGRRLFISRKTILRGTFSLYKE